MSKSAKTLADRVRVAVENTGFTQSKFASEAKIKLRTLQDVLSGASQNPEMSTLQGISTLSKVSIDELVYGAQKGEEAICFKAASQFLLAFSRQSVLKQSVVRAIVYENTALIAQTGLPPKAENSLRHIIRQILQDG